MCRAKFSALQKLFARRFFILTKTTNYGLPQWEGSDRVLRTDFNEAMADIDTALQANADAVAEVAYRHQFTKLSEGSLSAANNLWEISLSGIDWSQWRTVHMLITPVLSSGSFIAYVNQSSGTGNQIADGMNGPFHILFLPLFNYIGWVHGFSSSPPDPNFVIDDLTWTDLSLVYLKAVGSSAMFQTGSSFTILGEK